MRFRILIVAFICCLNGSVFGQDTDWVAVLGQNRLTIDLNRKEISGPGFEWIKERAEASQFLSFGEAHGRAEIPMLVSHVYRELYASGYHYLALEMGPEIARALSDDDNLGRKRSVKRLAVKHPKAIAFAYDHELRMIATTGAAFAAPGQIFWGLDQAFGGKHLIKQLQRLSDTTEESEAAKAVLKSIRKSGNGHDYLIEADREGEVRLLRKAFKPIAGSREENLINTLETSGRIYRNWVKAYKTKEDRLRGYDNAYEREELMKFEFLKMYRQTQQLGVAKPKVILKFGGAHIEPGLTTNLVTSLGGFIKDFAVAEGSQATTIALQHTSRKNPPTKGRRQLLLQASGDEISLFDLSQLKDLAMSDPSIPADLKRMILRYDAVILIPNSKKAGIGNYIRSKLRVF